MFVPNVKLLLVITIALVPLFIRMMYSILGGFASPAIEFDSSGNRILLTPHDALQTFNLRTGNLAAYIIMDFIMGYIVMLAYIGAGLFIPLSRDDVGH